MYKYFTLTNSSTDFYIASLDIIGYSIGMAIAIYTSMNTYTVKYNSIYKTWMVINSATGLAQSAWTDKADAMKTARDLNRPLINHVV